VSADLDTLCGELYGPGDELLPSERRDGDRATALASEPGALSPGSVAGVFAGSQELFDEEVAWLSGAEAGGLSHSELETRLQVNGRELLRQLYQDHLDLRACREGRVDRVVGSDGVRRSSVEAGHERPLQTVFGCAESHTAPADARTCMWPTGH